MPLKLNKLTEKYIQERTGTLMEDQRDLLAEPPQTTNALALENYHDNVGEDACELGLLLYQQEGREADIQAQLRLAGEHLCQMHAVRDIPVEGEYRIPWLFLKALALAVSFPGKTPLRSLAAFEEWRYYGREEHPEAKQLVRYLGILKAFVGGLELDDRTAMSIQDQAALDSASKYERRFLLPQIRALRAVAAGNQDGFTAAMKELLQSHQAEAAKGELAKEAEGLMCLPGLMLAKLARDRGMQAGVESPYLPVKLLE